jgi:predicted transcriptional regulator
MAVAGMIDQEITQYLPHLNAKQKQAVLNVVKTFAAEQQDWWDEIGEAQQQAIDKSLAEMKAGDVSSHADVMKKYKKWLKK